MADHRNAILEAGLGLLREEGLAGFTQPRMAARAGLRQSHLTYYFPTRSALLAAVGRLAVDNQLASAGHLARNSATQPDAIIAITTAIMRHENTRVLVALNQAADRDPALRDLFNELTEGFVERLTAMLRSLGFQVSQDRVDLLHALFVGLAVIDLATSRSNGEARAKAALATAFGFLSGTQHQQSE